MPSSGKGLTIDLDYVGISDLRWKCLCIVDETNLDSEIPGSVKKEPEIAIDQPPRDHAHNLVQALESFVRSVIAAHSPMPSTDRSICGETQAQSLLRALEDFIGACTRPTGISQLNQTAGDDTGAEHCEESIDDDSRTDPNSIIIPRISANETTSQKPQLLIRALEEAHRRVFNKMPLRLLMFKPDGSGFDLLDRNAIYSHISTAMEATFDEAKMTSDIAGLQRTSLGYTAKSAEDEIIAGFISHHTRYAILSHTWLHDTPGEVTHANWKTGAIDRNSAGYRKLAKFCEVAATDYGMTFGWMDTICIDKESSAELDESIRSMYKWYHDASICITYLAQTIAIQHMRDDPWFTRGWTLQELLAPHSVKFYNARWEKLVPGAQNDTSNISIQEEIRESTAISPYEFSQFRRSPRSIRLSRKMRWAANRRVTREEDIAYSLMGIFDVSVSIAYGEGSERAFFRLMKEILSTSKDNALDVVNWAQPGPVPEFGFSDPRGRVSSLIPLSPSQYLWGTERAIHWFPPARPVTLTHLGLHLRILLLPAISSDPASNLPFTPIGNYYATVTVEAGYSDSRHPWRKFPTTYNLLDKDVSGSNGWDRTETRFQMIFGILNFTETEDLIFLPPTHPCFAVCLYSSQDLARPRDNPYQTVELTKIQTAQAVVFRLEHISPGVVFKILKSQLSEHGMRLVTTYL